MPAFDARKEIPGYAEFLDEQEAIRDSAWLRLPGAICGLPVLPLTTRHLLWLLIIKSPFVGGQPLRFEEAHLHVAAFMRIVSPKFSALSRWRRRLFFWRYRRTVYPRKVNPVEMVMAIKTWQDKQMQDRLSGRGGGESYWSVAATVVHGLGRYGWDMDKSLDIPLAAAFQLLKIQRQDQALADGRKQTMFNPSDEFKTRWFTKIENDLREYEAELSGQNN